MSIWNEIRQELEEAYRHEDQRLFRGHSNARYKLESTITRECRSVPEFAINKIEGLAAIRFSKAAHLHLPPSSIPQRPDGKDNRAILHWWIYMQHYGAPTRLLDWTRSPYVAVFFACLEHWEVDGEVWYFNGDALLNERKPDLIRVNWNKTSDEDKKVYGFAPQIPTDRMLAQKGAFTVSTCGRSSQEKQLEPYGLSKIVIPACEKVNILETLMAMNISVDVLFPGLDGIGRELKKELRVLMVRSEPKLKHHKIEEISKKVKWEWNMLCNLAEEGKERSIKSSQAVIGPLRSTAIENAILDSFLLHSRVLYDFFCKRPRGDDVVAQHFFDDPPSWQSGDLFPTVRNQQTELNKHLAHLTYARLEGEIAWDLQAMFKEFKEAWDKFIRLLPDDRRSWFD